MKEVVFQGALDPHTPIGQGWLRASHRKLDKKLTLPFRPYHTHDEKQPLEPGRVYELDIEIVPTCIVVPKGYRVGLTVRGRDYVYPGGSGGRLSNMKNEFTLRGLEQARRSALAHHVHRIAPMGARVLINGIRYKPPTSKPGKPGARRATSAASAKSKRRR